MHIEPGRPARPGQLILERRFELARLSLGDGLASVRMLDLGCGNGAQTQHFISEVRKAYGCDVTPLSQTEHPAATGSFTFVRGSAQALPFRPGAFDLVTSFEVLEHVPDDYGAFKQIAAVLRPGGRFLISVPNKWWLFESHGAVVPGLNFLPWNRIPFVGWLPTPIHSKIARARIYTLHNASKLASKAGLVVESSGYITAPLDVLPEGWLRRLLRATIFRGVTTRSPFLAVNLYLFGKKPD